MRRKWWIWLTAALIMIVAAFVLWAGIAASPMPEAVWSLQSDELVVVREDPWLIFEPANGAASLGLIIYPGGRVAPEAYAPLARAVAEEGYLSVIIPMPLNLAVLAPDSAENVLAAFPDIEQWVIGGHSLGGAMAARFVDTHPEAIDGLVLLASYPAESQDLADQELGVLSIYGTNDGLASVAEVEGAADKLPSTTVWVRVEGGNHAQFGWYGEQSGDLAADITREEQGDVVLDAVLMFLAALEE